MKNSPQEFLITNKKAWSSAGGFHLLQCFRVGLDDLLSPHLYFISVLILDLCVFCDDALMSYLEVLHVDRITVSDLWTTAEPRARVVHPWKWFKRLSNLLQAIQRRCFCSGLLSHCLVCFVLFAFLSVFDFALWAASWQNQQNDCALSKDSDQRMPRLI